MGENQNADEVRRRIAQCEEEMKRAGERAREAVRNLHRATGIFGAPTQIDLPRAEEALAEVRAAGQAYQAESDRREELRALLADLEQEGPAAARTVPPPKAQAEFDAALHSRAQGAPPPPAPPQSHWKAVAIVALAALSLLIIAGAVLVGRHLAMQPSQKPPVAMPLAVQPPVTPEAAQPPEAPKPAPTMGQKAFDDTLLKVQNLLGAGKTDDALALLKLLAERYDSDPIAPRIRAEIAATLYIKADGLASADKSADALDIFRTITRDYAGTETAVKAEKRLPDALLAVAKGQEDHADLEQSAATLESLVKEFPNSPAAAAARQALPGLRLRLAEAYLKLQPERAIALLRQVASSPAAEAETAKARKMLAAALVKRADERYQKQQYKDEAADLREAIELDRSLRITAGLSEAEALARGAVQAKEKNDIAGAIALWKELQQRHPDSHWLSDYGAQFQPLIEASAAAGAEPLSDNPAVLWALAQNEIKADHFEAARPYLEKTLRIAAGTAPAAKAEAALADHDYAAAQAKLQAGDAKGARPILEKIIADYSRAVAAGPAARDLARIKATPPEMVYVPAGEFIMGLDKDRVAALVKRFHVPAFMEAPWFGLEEPANRVPLTGFYMDEHPVTNDQYKAYVDAGHEPPPSADWQGKEIKPGCKSKPVTNVNWDEAAAYAKWAGKRLPKESEWEKAARGTDGRLYPWGDDFDIKRLPAAVAGVPGPQPVDQAPEALSPYGASDTIGNVLQWTADALNPYPGADPTGLPFDETKRVVRGADSETAAQLPVLCMVTTRAGRDPATRAPNLGFRCVKDAE